MCYLISQSSSLIIASRVPYSTHCFSFIFFPIPYTKNRYELLSGDMSSCNWLRVTKISKCSYYNNRYNNMKLDDGDVHEGPAFDSCRPPKIAFKCIILCITLTKPWYLEFRRNENVLFSTYVWLYYNILYGCSNSHFL